MGVADRPLPHFQGMSSNHRPQMPWSPTASNFVNHQLSHVVNFWKQGRQAEFRLESLPSGQAELCLRFNLLSPHEVIPPPNSSTPAAPQRPIPPLFPGGVVPKAQGKGPSSTPKFTFRQRKSFRRSVMHHATKAASTLSPPLKGTLRAAAASVCIKQLQAQSFSTPAPNQRKRPRSNSVPSLSPSSLPLASRICSDLHLSENGEASPNSSPIEKLRETASSPLLLNCSTPAPVRMPHPNLNLTSSPSPGGEWASEVESETCCPNCGDIMSAAHQCTLTCSQTQDLSESPFRSSSHQSDVLSTGELDNVTPIQPRRLKMMKFCDTCDSLHPSGSKCQSCDKP